MTETPTTLTPKPAQIAEVNAAYWASLYKPKLQAGPFSFTRREFQIEFMASRAKRKCAMKAPQAGGVTECVILDSFHGLRHGRYKLGVLYLFPTDDHVTDFSKTRWTGLINDNKELIGVHVREDKRRSTNAANLKKIGQGFLYLRGARLSPGEGGDRQSTNLVSIPADKVVFDEVQLMDEAAIPLALGRMTESPIQEEVYLGNPTWPGGLVDRIYRKGDQRHWHRRCACGEWCCAELTFPDCVHVSPGLNPKHRGHIACLKCGREVGPWLPYASAGPGAGEWQPSEPNHTAYMESYRFSHLMSANIDPSDVLDHFNNPPHGDRTSVYRNELGMPWMNTQDQLSPEDVMKCFGAGVMPQNHPGPCAMGVDFGKKLHLVIGGRIGSQMYEIFRASSELGSDNCEKWIPVLLDLARRFNVRCAVCDHLPYPDGVRKFQDAARSFKVWLCHYTENGRQDGEYSEPKGTVAMDRTQICDRSHRVFVNQDITLPSDCPEMREFVSQCCVVAKVKDKNEKTGLETFRYVHMDSDKNDHYRHALNYFLLAADRTGKIESPGCYRGGRRKMAISEYDLLGV